MNNTRLTNYETMQLLLILLLNLLDIILWITLSNLKVNGVMSAVKSIRMARIES